MEINPSNVIQNYADPLRNFARQDFSKIIPMYEAKTLFTNIDAIVAASKLFLEDLEKMWASAQGETTVGDICLRHVGTPELTVVLITVPAQGPQDSRSLSHVSQ